MKELGIYAYNSLKDNIESIQSPDFIHREFKSPALRKLVKITLKRFIQFEEKDKIITVIISIIILIVGTTLCSLNNYYPFLLFYIEMGEQVMALFFQSLMITSFIINFIIFFIIIEGISRLFYKKNENTINFLISFPIIQLPMTFYLALHLILKWFNLINISIFNLFDKILLIIFQVWSLWLLSYSLCVKKELKIESSLIVSLFLHYGSFMIILFLLV
ncbi:MAG: hypothetical protein ACFFB8_08795 [Promethearchaeota archaeon]